MFIVFLAVSVLTLLVCVNLAGTYNLGAADATNGTTRQDNPPTADASADITSGIAPLNVTFTGSGDSTNNTVESYYWNFRDGFDNSSKDTWHVFKSAGTFNVTLTVTDNETLWGSDWVIIEVIANQLPIANYTHTNTSGIVPFTISMDANATDLDGTIVSYYWDFGDGNYSTEEAPTHEYMRYGAFTVKLNVTDDKGGETKESFSVDVEQLQVDFKNVKTFMTLPSKVKFVFSLRDQEQHAIEWDPDFIQENIKIFEDSTEIDSTETTYFVHTADNMEMEIILVLDFTNSMASWEENGSQGADVMVESANSLIDSQSAAARFAVIEYHDRNVEPKVLKNFTTNKDLVKDAITEFKDSDYDAGSSRCWDAVDKGLDLFTKDNESSIGTVKLLVFLSDGKDTSSSTTTSDIITKAQLDQISIYNIGVGDVDATDKTTLEGMSSQTGGKFYEAESLDDMEASFEEMAGDLGGQYVISYLTLRTTGTYEVKVDMTYYGSTSTFTETLDLGSIMGDDRVGAITFDPAGVEDKSADVYVRATHCPRNIDTFEFVLDTTKTVEIIFPTAEEGGICEGWSSSKGTGNSFTLSSSTEIEFGNFGILFILRISGIAESYLNIPFTLDNSIYSTDEDGDGLLDKRFDYPSSITLHSAEGSTDDPDADPVVEWWYSGFTPSGMTPDTTLAMTFETCKITTEEQRDTPTDGKMTLVTTYSFEGTCGPDVTVIYLYLDAAESGTFYAALDDTSADIEITPSEGKWEFTYVYTSKMDQDDYDTAKANSSGSDPPDMNYAAVGWSADARYDIGQKTATVKRDEDNGKGGGGGGGSSGLSGVAKGAIACGVILLIAVILIIVIIVVIMKKKGSKEGSSSGLSKIDDDEEEDAPPPPEDEEKKDDEDAAPPPPEDEDGDAPPPPEEDDEPPAPPEEDDASPVEGSDTPPPAPEEDVPEAPDEEEAPDMAPPEEDEGEAPPPPPE